MHSAVNWPDASDRILVVAPHQDDESIGCGGSIVSWRKAGAAVGVLWVSASDAGEPIGAEAATAAQMLGACWTVGLGYPPVGLAYGYEPLCRLISAMREFAPTVLLFPHADEDDRQHAATSQLAHEAAWLAAYPLPSLSGTLLSKPPRLLLGYEVWTPIRRPDGYFDTTDTSAEKAAIISCYASQIAIADHVSAALGLNRYRGLTSGTGEYAEAFILGPG